MPTRLRHFCKYIIKTISFSGLEIHNGSLYFIYSYSLAQEVISFFYYIVILNIRPVGCFAKCVTKYTFKVVIPCIDINVIAYVTSSLSPRLFRSFQNTETFFFKINGQKYCFVSIELLFLYLCQASVPFSSFLLYF